MEESASRGAPPWTGVALVLGASALVGPFLESQSELLEIVPTATAWEVQVGAIAIALSFAAAVFRFPAVGLSALALFVVLNLSQVLVRHHGFPSLLQCLAFPMALAASVERFHGRRESPIPGGFSLWLIGYVLLVLATSAVAKDRVLADERGIEAVKGLCIYFLVLGLASSMGRLRVALSSILLAGAAMGVLGIYQALSGNYGADFGGLARVKHAQIYGDVFEPRIAGPFGDPNFFAQVLVLLVPLALYSAWGERTPRARACFYAVALALAAASILTYSRGGALALAVALLLTLLDRGIRPRTVFAACGLAACALLLVPGEFTRRLETIRELLPGGEEATKPDSSFAERKLYAASAFEMFLDHPVAGVGAGNYTVHYETYATRVGSAARSYEEPTARHYPHSLGLEIASESGLLGLALFACAMLSAFVSLERSRERSRARHDVRGFELARGLQIALAGYFVAALFLHGDFQRPFWFVLGLVAALSGSSREGREPVPATDKRGR